MHMPDLRFMFTQILLLSATILWLEPVQRHYLYNALFSHMFSRGFSLAIFSSPKNSTIDQQSWYTYQLKNQHWLIITLSQSNTLRHLLSLLLTWEMVCCPLNTKAFIKVMIFNQVKFLWYIEYINRRIRLKLHHVDLFSNLDMLSETPRYPTIVNNR